MRLSSPFIHALFLLPLALLFSCASHSAPPSPSHTCRFAPIPPLSPDLPWTLSRIELSSPDGPIRGVLAIIDLAHPRLEVVVTDPLSPPDLAALSPGVEARLERTRDWALRNRIDLAANANFFARHPDSTADIVGLSVSDSRTVSTARCDPSSPWGCDAALIFDSSSRARAVLADPLAAAAAYDAVAGAGPLLVDDSRNVAADARVAPTVRHPRTAAAVNVTGDRLFLFVIDGRQPDHSVGISLPDLADLLISLGAHDAINLDGGGSSEITLLNPALNSVAVLNSPSEPAGRPVANHLGFRLRPPPPLTPLP